MKAMGEAIESLEWPTLAMLFGDPPSNSVGNPETQGSRENGPENRQNRNVTVRRGGNA